MLDQPDRNDDEPNDRAIVPLPNPISESTSRTLAKLDTRIASADLGELIVLTKVRRELLRQDDELEENRHRRQMEAREGYVRAGLSGAALIAGTGIVLAGFTLPGCFVLGAGLYGLAPKFIDSVSKQVFGGKNND